MMCQRERSIVIFAFITLYFAIYSLKARYVIWLYRLWYWSVILLTCISQGNSASREMNSGGSYVRGAAEGNEMSRSSPIPTIELKIGRVWRQFIAAFALEVLSLSSEIIVQIRQTLLPRDDARLITPVFCFRIPLRRQATSVSLQVALIQWTSLTERSSRSFAVQDLFLDFISDIAVTHRTARCERNLIKFRYFFLSVLFFSNFDCWKREGTLRWLKHR